MVKEKLSEKTIKKIKHKPKQFKLSDGGGLYLLVHPNGSKYWRFDFRMHGKQKSSSLGVWPEVSLVEARKIRNSAKKKIREGINPIQEKRMKKILQQSDFFEGEKVMPDTLEQNDEMSRVSEFKSLSFSKGNNNQVALNELFIHVFPEHRDKEFNEISKDDLIGILKNLVDNRKKLFQISWSIFPSYPLLQLCVLFVLLFFVTDFFLALITTGLYFFFSVCFTICYDLWKKKKIDN